MDFREELNQIKNVVSAEEFISATILMAKIILNHSQKQGILKIIFNTSNDDKIISSVEIDSGEQIVLIQKKQPLFCSVTLTKIEEILNKDKLYCVRSKDGKTLCLTPNRW